MKSLKIIPLVLSLVVCAQCLASFPYEDDPLAKSRVITVSVSDNLAIVLQDERTSIQRS